MGRDIHKWWPDTDLEGADRDPFHGTDTERKKKQEIRTHYGRYSLPVIEEKVGAFQIQAHAFIATPIYKRNQHSAPPRGSPASIVGQFMCELWWMKWDVNTSCS